MVINAEPILVVNVVNTFNFAKPWTGCVARVSEKPNWTTINDFNELVIDSLGLCSA